MGLLPIAEGHDLASGAAGVGLEVGRVGVGGYAVLYYGPKDCDVVEFVGGDVGKGLVGKRLGPGLAAAGTGEDSFALRSLRLELQLARIPIVAQSLQAHIKGEAAVCERFQ